MSAEFGLAPQDRSGASLTSLPIVTDQRGTLVYMETGHHIPFAVNRVFLLRDLKPGHDRGQHAHRRCHQFLVNLAGRATAELDDGRRRWSRTLSAPNEGLYVAPMTWLVLRDFDASTICLVLASDTYDAGDYIRDYREFVAAARKIG